MKLETYPVVGGQYRGTRRGIVAPLVAVSLLALLGVLALVIDVGIMQDRRRHLQGSADAAALAGATDLYTNWYHSEPDPMGTDPEGTARASAIDIAARNGYVGDDGVTTTVTVNVSNSSVGHVNPNYPTVDGITFPVGYVEVIITYREPARFSAVFGAQRLPVTARALARGRSTAMGIGMILLDPHAGGALSISGAGTSGGITVIGGSTIVNSDAANAGKASGSHAFISSDGYEVGGGLTPLGNFLGVPRNLGAIPTLDPLRSRLPPTSTEFDPPLNLPPRQYPSGSNYTMDPGIYTGDWNPSGNVTLNSGIYVIKGGITMAGEGNSVTGMGVLIYFTGSFTTTGSWKNAGWNITAMTEGPFKGIAMFQSRDSTGVFKIGGDGTINITGILYAPKANVDSGGNGAITLNGQWISNQLNAHGNGNVSITYGGPRIPGPRTIQLVE